MAQMKLFPAAAAEWESLGSQHSRVYIQSRDSLVLLCFVSVAAIAIRSTYIQMLRPPPRNLLHSQTMPTRGCAGTCTLIIFVPHSEEEFCGDWSVARAHGLAAGVTQELTAAQRSAALSSTERDECFLFCVINIDERRRSLNMKMPCTMQFSLAHIQCTHRMSTRDVHQWMFSMVISPLCNFFKSGNSHTIL